MFWRVWDIQNGNHVFPSLWLFPHTRRPRRSQHPKFLLNLTTSSTLHSPVLNFSAYTVVVVIVTKNLKLQCHEIFCFWFFSWISFAQASDYTIRAVSNFFENSRRYSELKVCYRCQRHRWQMQKTFKQKNFYNFVWTPLGCRVNIYINYKFLPSSWL